MNNIIIIGAGGFGREVAWLVKRINQTKPTWNLLGFIDDCEEFHGSTIDGYHVIGGMDLLHEYKNSAMVVCAIGTSQTRKEIVNKLDGFRFATLIDPSVIISDKVKIGEGSIICAGSILTVNIELGNHTIINLDCTVGHDAHLHNYVTLYPSVNISGNTVLGDCVEMGTGSQIIQGIKINNNTIVGAGAVVVKDITEPGTYAGVPAKKLH